MDTSFVNKIQDIKDAIKNSERILDDDLRQIQNLQNTLILRKQKIIELDSLISDSIIQEDILKRKNSIIQTNIDHIKNTSSNHLGVIEKLKKTYQNSETLNRQAKEKHQNLLDKINELEVNYAKMENQMNSIMSDFEEHNNEKKKLTSQFDQLHNFDKSYFELSNKFELLQNQENFLQEQLFQFNSISDKQEKEINSLKEENEFYTQYISQYKKESTYFQQNIKKIEDKLALMNTKNCKFQISQDYINYLKTQITLTENQINHMKMHQYSIEKTLAIEDDGFCNLKSFDIEEFTKKAEKIQNELLDDKKTLILLDKEKDDLANESVNTKFYTAYNQEKLLYLQNLQTQIQKLESKDPIYSKELSELHSKSKKLEIDLKTSEDCILRKKTEQEELKRRIQINQEIKTQHENQMEQIQSKFKAVEIKSNQEEIDKLHKENKSLMQKILKFEDSIFKKKVKKKKVIKKQPFIH